MVVRFSQEIFMSLHSTRSKLFQSILACALLSGYPAMAAPQIDEQGAQELKAILNEMLDFQKSATAVNQGVMKFEGELKVERAAEYYAVTLPHITIADTSGGFFDMGIISLNAIPTDDPAMWKMSMALPTPMTGYDAQGNPVVSFDISRQRMSGVWHKDFGNFVKLDAAYENLVINAGAAGEGVVIPSMSAMVDLDKNEKDEWSGPAAFAVNGMKVMAGGREVFKADKFLANSEVLNISTAAIKQYKDNMTAIAEQALALPEGGQASPQHAVGIYNLIFDFLGNAWEGFSSEFAVEGLKIEVPAEDAAAPKTFRLGKATYGLDMRGFKGDNITIASRMSYDGVESQLVLPGIEGIIPTGANLSYRINNIPYKQIAELGKNTLRSSLVSPEMAQMSGMQMVMVLPQILAQAGTNFELKDLAINGQENYGLQFTGKVNADAVSPMGITADVNGRIHGFEWLTGKLSGIMNNPQTSQGQKAEVQKAVQTLALLQLLGRQEKDGQGRDVRVYEFKLGPQGQMLLNGADLNAVLGQMSPGLAQDSKPAAPQ